MARQRIVLAAEEAEELSRRSRATTVSVRDRQRAEIILLSAQGLTAAHRRATGDLAACGEPLGGTFCAAPAGGVERSWRARAQAVVAASSGAAGAPASGDAAAPSGGWSCRTMARAAAISPASVQRLWVPVTSSRISRAPSNCPTTSALKRSSGTSSGCISIRQTRRSCRAATKITMPGAGAHAAGFDATPVIDKATFGGNAFNDFLGGQYRRHTATSRRSLS